MTGRAALTAQRALLRAKRDRLDGLLRLVEVALKGETTMEMAFTAFDRAGVRGEMPGLRPGG